MSIHIPKEGDVYQVVNRPPQLGETMWHTVSDNWIRSDANWTVNKLVLEPVPPPPANKPKYRYLHHGRFHSAITGLFAEGNCAATFDQNAYPPGVAEAKARAEVDELNKAAEPKERFVAIDQRTIKDTKTGDVSQYLHKSERDEILRILNAGVAALGGEPK